MPSIASDSCHITSGCSGLPKLRQLTSASGRAPTHARFSTDSATTSAVPVARVDRAPPVVAVGGEREAAAGVDAGGRVLQPQHGGVAARALDGVEEQLVVVLRPDPRRVARASTSRSAPASVGAGRRRRRRRAARRGRPARRGAGRRAARRPRATAPARRRAPRRRAASRIAQPAGPGDGADHRRPRTSHRSADGEHLVEVLRARRSRASAPGTRSS